MPSVTVVIPSYNQAEFLAAALTSVFDQAVEAEVIVVDGGSTDQSLSIIEANQSRLLWWRSRVDEGQAAAINEGVTKGSARYICWLNSDDYFLTGGLQKMVEALEANPLTPAVYGKCIEVDVSGRKKRSYWTAPFSERHLANRCFIAQPATLIRRSAWEQVGGLDGSLQMSMDYDLWWRLYRQCGELVYIKDRVAASRRHVDTKTSKHRFAHYRESMMVVHKYFGSVPLKWYLAWPFRVVLWHYLQQISRYFRVK